MPGRFAEKFSAEQKAGIVSAVLEDGIRPSRAVELAKQGRLYELGPFEMSKTYAYTLVRQEERRRAGDAPERTDESAERQLDRIARRMVASLDRSSARP